METAVEARRRRTRENASLKHDWCGTRDYQGQGKDRFEQP